MSAKKVPLARAYDENGKSFDAVTFRAPKWKDYLAVGGPVKEWQRAGDSMVLLTHFDRLEKYAERLIVFPAADDLAELDLVDALAVEEAIADFFTDAMLSRRKPKPSSGTPGSPSPPSGNSDSPN